jgi:hypothetical protein
MCAQKFSRNKDYSGDADNNAGGRSTIDPVGLDGELDEVVDSLVDHADRLDLLLRADKLMASKILQGHEFSEQSLSLLSALIGTNSALVWRGLWANDIAYVTGNLVKSGDAVHICLVPHTSPATGPFVSGTDWDVFINTVEDILPPQEGKVLFVLHSDGTNAFWNKVVPLSSEALAPSNDTELTGDSSIENLKLQKSYEAETETLTFSAAGQLLDFASSFLKYIDVTGSYTSAIRTSNVRQGGMVEVHFRNAEVSDFSMVWPSEWSWMGYAPSVLPSGKKAVLSLRAPVTTSGVGGDESDVVALWSVHP